jgi:hypothetical protein
VQTGKMLSFTEPSRPLFAFSLPSTRYEYRYVDGDCQKLPAMAVQLVRQPGCRHRGRSASCCAPRESNDIDDSDCFVVGFDPVITFRRLLQLGPI